MSPLGVNGEKIVGSEGKRSYLLKLNVYIICGFHFFTYVLATPYNSKRH